MTPQGPTREPHRLGARSAPALFALGLLATACGRSDPHVVPSVRAADLDPATVSEVEVTGVIDNERFTLKDAWFRVESKEGRQRVDLILSDGEVARLCADANPEQARHVWLRFGGVREVAAGTYRSDADSAEPEFSAQFEAHDEHGWHGRAGAAAVVVDPPVEPPEGVVEEIKRAPLGYLTGRVRACFGPGQEGCVAGTFRAQLCLTEFDLAGPYREHPAGDSALEDQPHPAGKP